MRRQEEKGAADSYDVKKGRQGHHRRGWEKGVGPYCTLLQVGNKVDFTVTRKGLGTSAIW